MEIRCIKIGNKLFDLRTIAAKVRSADYNSITTGRCIIFDNDIMPIDIVAGIILKYHNIRINLYPD